MFDFCLGIQEPTLTIVLFSIFSVGSYQLSRRLTANYEGLAIAASRAGVFLINFGFWIGFLWGDLDVQAEVVIDDWVFSSLWAIALVATGAWAWKRSRRWVVNVVAVFGAIHFYTQWFERLGGSAESVLVAGLMAIGIAIGLRALNVKLSREA